MEGKAGAPAVSGEKDMVTIETVATIEDGTITAKVPTHLPKGEHRVVIVVEEAPLVEGSSRRFPNMATFRASLGASTYPGNTIVEMREDER